MATYTISIKNEAGDARQQGLYLFPQAPSGGLPLAWLVVPHDVLGRSEPWRYTVDYGAYLGQPGAAPDWPAPAPAPLAPDYRIPAAAGGGLPAGLTLHLTPDGRPGTVVPDAGADAASQAANPSHV